MAVKEGKKRQRRLDSAIAGGTFVSKRDLQERWGCDWRTALSRIRKAGIPEYFFSEKSVRYKLDDVERYERQALAAGFLKRGEELKAMEARKLAKVEAGA